jgi:hypothetical protein
MAADPDDGEEGGCRQRREITPTRGVAGWGWGEGEEWGAFFHSARAVGGLGLRGDTAASG